MISSVYYLQALASLEIFLLKTWILSIIYSVYNNINEVSF
jgi:hypothetical protein